MASGSAGPSIFKKLLLGRAIESVELHQDFLPCVRRLDLRELPLNLGQDEDARLLLHFEGLPVDRLEEPRGEQAVARAKYAPAILVAALHERGERGGARRVSQDGLLDGFELASFDGERRSMRQTHHRIERRQSAEDELAVRHVTHAFEKDAVDRKADFELDWDDVPALVETVHALFDLEEGHYDAVDLRGDLFAELFFRHHTRLHERLPEFSLASLHQHARESELVSRDAASFDQAFAQAVALEVTCREDDEAVVEIDTLDARAEVDLEIAAQFFHGDLAKHFRERDRVERADPVDAAAR